MRPRPFKDLARRFLIRRYGISVNWNCTYREIAQVTGIPEARVSRICRQHGYPVEHDNQRPVPYMPVDKFFALPNSVARNLY
ncbi:hypothetical protein CK222_21725 [Mesorhizobium sp. WSM3866]|uniref:hypothetical protein n=1 Tax=Mesorhizobium sp. WSM3866 TaxID=422271 RepID=UPI000BB0AA28|nr:hypothetical protein [Mesorhizobium sp. WSM3866]PBB41776.1 hypothetical protein CK222_21725 [Mesorhizobium sp. WSM3866]RWI96410.1 MAG: hypothetical protein EOR22_06530 [Mesorhizobium sp.]